MNRLLTILLTTALAACGTEDSETKIVYLPATADPEAYDPTTEPSGCVNDPAKAEDEGWIVMCKESNGKSYAFSVKVSATCMQSALKSMAFKVCE